MPQKPAQTPAPSKFRRISRRQILKFCERVVREFDPDRIILFGSYAYGRPTPDSDVDVLVIMPFEGQPHIKATEIRIKIHAPFPMDLLVRTPEQIRERVEMGDCFMEEIVKKGEVLYETNHGGVGSESRRRLHGVGT